MIVSILPMPQLFPGPRAMKLSWKSQPLLRVQKFETFEEIEAEELFQCLLQTLEEPLNINGI